MYKSFFAKYNIMHALSHLSGATKELGLVKYRDKNTCYTCSCAHHVVNLGILVEAIQAGLSSTKIHVLVHVLIVVICFESY